MKEYEKAYKEGVEKALKGFNEAGEFMKLDEKKLFGGSLEAQYKKMNKAMTEIAKELRELKILVIKNPKAKQELGEEKIGKLDGLLKDCEAVLKIINDSNFKIQMYAVDYNTNWRGKAINKNSLSSDDF